VIDAAGAVADAASGAVALAAAAAAGAGAACERRATVVSSGWMPAKTASLVAVGSPMSPV
jgi:hypothetical protein